MGDRKKVLQTTRIIASVPAPAPLTRYLLSLLDTQEFILHFYKRSTWELINTDVMAILYYLLVDQGPYRDQLNQVFKILDFL